MIMYLIILEFRKQKIVFTLASIYIRYMNLLKSYLTFTPTKQQKKENVSIIALQVLKFNEM